MSACLFSIDKQKGLDIMADLLSHLQTKDSISVNKQFVARNYYLETDQPQVIDFKHQLAIVELELDVMVDDVANRPLCDFVNEVHQAIQNKQYNRSTSIEIHEGSGLEGDTICLIAYAHETSAECDVSYPVFTYDDFYQCFIIKDAFWGAPNGIDCNGIVTILDFSDYL